MACKVVIFECALTEFGRYFMIQSVDTAKFQQQLMLDAVCKASCERDSKQSMQAGCRLTQA